MPRVRKLHPDEVVALERDEQALRTARLATLGLEDNPTEEPPELRTSISREAPKIGDIVEFSANDTGIVLRVRHQSADSWDAAELFIDHRRQWVYADQIGSIVGRPRGISRIDHPRRRTHGWFVRVSDGHHTKVAKLFSDMKYRGRAAALAAALTFHEHESQHIGFDQPQN